MPGPMPLGDASADGAPAISVRTDIPWRMLFPVPLPPLSNGSRDEWQTPANGVKCPEG